MGVQMLSKDCKYRLAIKLRNKTPLSIKLSNTNWFEVEEFLFSHYVYKATHIAADMEKYTKAKYLSVDNFNNGLNTMYSFCLSNFYCGREPFEI